MKMNFKNKVCIITGAARGIGKAIVEALLQNGAKCLIADILYKEGETTEAELAGKYGAEHVFYMRVDVASQRNFEAAFLACKERFGSVDILVNNAAMIGEVCWETQIQTNLMGTITGTQLAVRFMRRGGVVVNISSNLALVSLPMMPTYAAAKTAILQYTRCAGAGAHFSQHGVKILAVCPGATVTPIRDCFKHVGVEGAGMRQLNDTNFGVASMEAAEVAAAVLAVMGKGASGSIWLKNWPGRPEFEVPFLMTLEEMEELGEKHAN